MEDKESDSFTFVPKHLLKFKADDDIKAYYRLFLEINHAKDKSRKSRILHCPSCFMVLTINDRPRIQSAQKITKRISRLLKKSDITTTKKEKYLLKKYLRSSSQMIVKCHACNGTTRIPIMTNEAKRGNKKNLLMSKSKNLVPNSLMMDVKKKKKKKKGKKQKSKDADTNCGLRLPSNMDTTTSTNAIPTAQIMSRINPLSKPINSINSQVNFNVSLKQQPKILDSKTKKRELDFQSSINTLKKKQKNVQLKQFLLQETQEKPRASLSDFLSSL